MAKITFVSNREQLNQNLLNAWQDVTEQLAVGNEAVFFYFIKAADNREKLDISLLKDSSFLCITWMGNGSELLFSRILEAADTLGIPYAAHLTSNNTGRFFKGIGPDEYQNCTGYLNEGGLRNTQNLFRFLLHHYYDGSIAYDNFAVNPWKGIYDPVKHAAITLEQYKEECYDPALPLVAVHFPRDWWVWDNLRQIDALMQEIRSGNCNALAFFSHWNKDEAASIPAFEDNFKDFCVWDGKVMPDVLINCLWFSLIVGRNIKDSALLEHINIPIIQAEVLLQPVERWRDSLQGLDGGEMHPNIILPEFDGSIHGIPIAGKGDGAFAKYQLCPIEENIKMLARRAINWAVLKHTPKTDRRVAVILHNYPPSNSNIGTAMALDSLRSTERLLAALKESGYQTGNIPTDKQDWLIKELTKGLTNDRTYLNWNHADEFHSLSVTAYQKWFEKLDGTVQNAMLQDWGEIPGTVFSFKDRILIPGLLEGNIFISVQPPRGFGEDPDKVYHNGNVPPTHHYLAYYQWIRDVFQADAVVHIGTHGSLEWLPGKGAGLDERSYPYLAIWDLPNIYPYLISVTCEGIQAKRRSAAVLVDHLPAPVEEAGLYGGLAELEKLTEDYYDYAENDNAGCEDLQKLILDKVAELELTSEIFGRETNDREPAFQEKLISIHSYLNSIRDRQCRVGLHVLGEVPEDGLLARYLVAMTRCSNGDVPSLPAVIAATLHKDYDALREYDKDNSLVIIRNLCLKVIQNAIREDRFRLQAEEVKTLTGFEPSEENQLDINTVLAYVRDRLLPALRKTDGEIRNILHALDGEYVAPGPSGAPTCGMADVLPTGRNFFGVDPRIMPSQAAWHNGKKLAEAVISAYIADEGRYPERIGMVFWSGNNMRTKGLDIAEVMALLGVEPVWEQNGRIKCCKVIDLAELKRPRIDVTLRISGMYRDSLYDTVKFMDTCIKTVADLPESPEDNYLRKHFLEDKEELLRQGNEECEAVEQATLRIFGSAPGTYGAGVGIALENKNWDNEMDLGKIFINWGSYAYGSNVNGKFLPDLFRKQLSTMDVTVKNEDNYEVTMLESDDYNAFHGGMIAAVRSLRGKKPRSYCGDTSDNSKIELRSLDQEMKLLYRTQVLNPKFIEGMKKHGYKGAADLASIVSHSFQWDATSKIVDDWMYEELTQKYVLDAEMRKWLQEVNPWALKKMTETLLEAAQRNLWNAENLSKEALCRLLLQIDGELEESSDD